MGSKKKIPSTGETDTQGRCGQVTYKFMVIGHHPFDQFFRVICEDDISVSGVNDLSFSVRRLPAAPANLELFLSSPMNLCLQLQAKAFFNPPRCGLYTVS